MRLRIGMAAFVAVALAALAAPMALANYVYWPNLAGSTIGRMALDGGQLDNSFIPTQNTGLDELTSVAVDTRYVYWAHTNNVGVGGIGRAKLDGSDVQPNFIPPSAGVVDPIGLAVTATHIYWASDDGNGLGRADLDGANVNPEFVSGLSAPCGLAADANFLYFTDYPGGNFAVARVPIGGGTPDEDFIPVTAGGDCGVAVDTSHVYWSESAPSPFTGSGVGRANLDGSGVDHAFIGPAGISAAGVAVTPQYVFWGGAFTSHFVGRAGIDGTAADNHFAAAGTDDAASPYLLAASPSNSFTLGKAKLHKRKGTATISATVPGPGTLVASGSSKKKTLKPAQTTAGAPGTLKLKIRAKGKAARSLRRKGRAKLKLGITYTPQGVAGIPSLQATRVVLKRRSR